MTQETHTLKNTWWRQTLILLLWFGRSIRYFSRWALRLLIICFLLISLLFAYLHIHGIPANFTDMWLRWLANQGYHLQIERLTLELDRGFTARHIRLFASPTDAAPILEAKSLTTTVDPARFFRSRRVVPIIEIEDGVIRANLGATTIPPPLHSPTIAIDQINARFSLSNQDFHLREFSARMLDIQLRGHGVVYLPPRQDEADKPAFSNPLGMVVAWLESAPPHVLEIVEQATRITFKQPPTADCAFAIYPANPSANSVSVRFDSPAEMTISGTPFDQCELSAVWAEGKISIQRFHLRNQNNHFQATGYYRFEDRICEGQLANTLPLSLFLPRLLPEDAKPFVAANQLSFDFPLSLTLNFGPAPVEQIADHLQGRLTFSQTGFRDLWMERMDARFTKTGNVIELTSGDFQIGKEAERSHLRASNGRFHLLSKEFFIHLEGTLNPYAAKSILTPNQQNILAWFTFDEPASGTVNVGGVVGDPAIYVYGPVKVNHFQVSGGHVDSAEGYLNITNETMHITEAIATRPEGIVQGEAHMCFSNQTLRVNVDSTFDPRVATQLMGPFVYNFFTPFHLNTPTRIRAEGVYDYYNFSLNDLTAHVEATKLGYDRWTADSAIFDVSIKGRRFTFTNITGTAYGGRFQGDAVLYPVFRDDNWRYGVNARVNEMELDKVLADTLPNHEPSTLRGRIDGDIEMTGYIGKGRGPDVNGKGYAYVRNGHLFQTKAFKWLSDVLTHVIPDFSLFAQTDAHGGFTIADSKVSSEHIQLQGSVFSVQAAGAYGFDHQIDYTMEVQLLRGGPIARLIRFVTRPVTRLLEFRLTGSFAEPRWRPLSILPTEWLSGSPGADEATDGTTPPSATHLD